MNGKTRDGCVPRSHPGDWGAYETACFSGYERVDAVGPTTVTIVGNQPGQDQGVEANGLHFTGLVAMYHAWRGPDR